MGVTIKGSASKVATPNIADHFLASIVKRRGWILGSWGKHPHNGWDGNFLQRSVGWQGGFPPFVQHVQELQRTGQQAVAGRGQVACDGVPPRVK